jgi:hypothetical protein
LQTFGLPSISIESGRSFIKLDSSGKEWKTGVPLARSAGGVSFPRDMGMVSAFLSIGKWG